MPHIHTGAGQHDACVSFFIVRTDLGEPHLTYHRHRKTGKLAMYGGHVELDENPWEAALHEIVEESGYAHDQLTILQPTRRLTRLTDAVVHPVPVISSTGRFPVEPAHFHTDLLYALVADAPPRGVPGEGESTDIRLLTAADLDQVPAENIVEMWREAGRYILTDVLIDPAWVPLPLTDFGV